MINDYIIKERLGVGSYGTVYKAKKKNSNKIYVIKQISLLGLAEQQINEYKLEASILSSIKSNYVVKYYDSFEEKNNLNIIMEYCDGGDLYQFIEEKKKTKHLLTENLIWELFIKMILGLSSIHNMKILHRDLKTQNIFLTKNLEVKIGDLGVAKKLNQTNFAKTFIGTPYYLSPELCSEKPYNDKSDIWAIGCILYELCTYKHPFNAKSQGALILRILNSNPERINQYYSRDLQKMIDLLLDKNYVLRPSCADILQMPIVLLKSKKCNLYSIILNENSKYHLIINLDNSINIKNKERKSYDGEKNPKNINKILTKANKKEEPKTKEKTKNNKRNEHYSLIDDKNNNKQQINKASNSFIKYNSKYNNHFYYNSNNKKKNIKDRNNSKKELINLSKNKNNKNKIIKNVINKIINQKSNKKINSQNNKNKKENHFIEMLNNALNEVNSKISYINKKEKSFLKNNKNLTHEKSKTPSIKNIKKGEISILQKLKLNNDNIINSKNEIVEYSNKQIYQNKYKFYLKDNCNTEEKLRKQKSIENIETKNIKSNKDIKDDIKSNKIQDNKDNNIDNNIQDNKDNNIDNNKQYYNKVDNNIKDNKKNINSNININKQKKIFDIQDFANNLNNYVNKYKTFEYKTLNKEHENHNINCINKKLKNNDLDYQQRKYNNINKDNNNTIEEESSNNTNSSNNKVFQININKLDNSISNNNNFINNNINININNINNEINNNNNNKILNSIMNFKIINNNDSDIHININNNSSINSINSNKANNINIEDKTTNNKILMNNNLINNSTSSEEENEKGLYSEEENSEEEQNEIVHEIKETNINQRYSKINNYILNKNINIKLSGYKKKLIEEKNILIEKINSKKDDILSLIGGTDYNYIINLYNNTDNANENVDEIYEKIEKFVNMHYDSQKKENFDNLYYSLITLDCQLVEKENEIKSI